MIRGFELLIDGFELALLNLTRSFKLSTRNLQLATRNSCFTISQFLPVYYDIIISEKMKVMGCPGTQLVPKELLILIVKQ